MGRMEGREKGTNPKAEDGEHKGRPWSQAFPGCVLVIFFTYILFRMMVPSVLSSPKATEARSHFTSSPTYLSRSQISPKPCSKLPEGVAQLPGVVRIPCRCAEAWHGTWNL